MGCYNSQENTGENRCKKELSLLRRVVLTPPSAIFTGLDELGAAQTFDEWLESGIHAALPANRFYPMPTIESVEDKSSDNVEATTGYGTSYVINEGSIAFTQTFLRDYCLSKKLLSFNGQEWRVIIFDNTNQAQVITTSAGQMGELATIWASQPRPNTESEFGFPKIQYSFVNPNEHKNREVIDTDLNYMDIKGLENVVMNIATVTTNLVITFLTECGNQDITSELALLSGETTAWLGDTAGVIAALTTAPTYASGKFTVTVASVTQDKISIADPSILYGLGVANKEQPDYTTVP